MANKVKAMSSIKDFLIKLKAVDELPEELAEDALQMTEEVKDALEEEEEVKVEDEEEVESVEEVKDECAAPNEKAMEDAMTKVLMKYGIIKDSAMKSLDELEEECDITKDEDGEEEVTVDPEVINNSDSARKELIREIKPVIAGIKDSAQRKKISDAFAKALRMNTTTTVDYAAIQKIKNSNVKDSKPATNDSYELGMEWAKKFNPHYKEG